MNNDERSELIRRASVQLSEHFDAGQILATRSEEDGSGCCRYQCGQGSWFERFGVVKAWILREEEAERVAAREEAEDG